MPRTKINKAGKNPRDVRANRDPARPRISLPAWPRKKSLCLRPRLAISRPFSPPEEKRGSLSIEDLILAKRFLFQQLGSVERAQRRTCTCGGTKLQ